MARRRRNYQAEKARRNVLAQQAGWKSYSQYEYARAKLKRSSLDVQGKWGRFKIMAGRELSKQDEKRAFWAFWQGLIDPRTNKNVQRGSPKSVWFVDYLHKVNDQDEWERKYAGKPR